MTQVERILDILDDGRYHSTPELVEKTRATRIASRIWDIKQKGFKVEDRFGDYGFKEYRLDKEPIQLTII